MVCSFGKKKQIDPILNLFPIVILEYWSVCLVILVFILLYLRVVICVNSLVFILLYLHVLLADVL